MAQKSKTISAMMTVTLLLLLSMLLPHPEAFALAPVQRTVLPNGLILLVCEEHSLPFVSLQVLLDAGAWRDPAGEEGLARLTAKALLMGTRKRDVTAIFEELDFTGASLTSGANRDYATLSLRILKKDLDKGLDLFMEALLEPTFPQDEIHREIEKTMASIQSAEDDPGEVAEREFQKALFGPNPYGHPVEGTRESLKNLSRDHVVNFYRSHYHPNASILVVVGNVTVGEVNAKLLPRLEKWPRGGIPEKPFPTNFYKGPKEVKIERPITQANILLGHEGVARSHPDYYALTVMNYILGGGGFTSRLVEEIRIKRGLAYAVDSYFDPGRFAGSFQISLQTKNASAREAISLSVREMERIQKELVSEKELEGAKKYLIGSFPMRFETQGKLLNFLSQVEYYGLGLDYPDRYASLIQSITREEVQRVAKTYLHPDRYILVVVANLKEAGFVPPSSP